MKRMLFFLSLAITGQSIKAQTTSVGIGTATPNASAMLDVTSPLNNKGVLLPRMTAAQRVAIASPATGLMVYETTTSSIWVFNGVVWVQQSSGGASPWTISGNNIYNSNTGNVGIGINAPLAKLHLSGLMKIDGGQVDIDDNIAKVRLLYNASPKGYFSLSSSTGDIQIGTNVGSNDAGKLQLETKSSPRLTIEPDGNVGIGTIAPNYKLDVRGDIYTEGNLRIEDGYLRINNTTNTKNWQFTNTSSLGGRLAFLQQGFERVIFQNDGNVGIGGDLPLTNNGFPNTKLHIETGQDAGLNSTSNGYLMMGPGSGSNIVIDNNEIVARTGFTTASNLYLQNNGGQLIVGAPTTINTDAEALKINGANSYLAFYNANDFKSLIGYIGGNLRFDAGGSNVSMVAQNIRMLPNVSGQVSIGTSVPAASGYKLTVDGKVLCEEVKVKLSSAWPDYVFDKKHQLLPIEQLSAFITANKHLPNIPAASEIEKNGIAIGDMQKKMMEKIEELTLYIIQQEKRIKQLESKQTNGN